ncbi:cytochrome P450 [Mycena sp. CBHHK59/15]|nr:cytochrome P450 [Mycena sp. CBHHK59/15]
MSASHALQIPQWLLIAGILYCFWRHALRKQRLPLPPGPRGLPFVGNILDIPPDERWLVFAELGNKWGDISSITVLGQTMIILNSVKVAEDLLDVRGANFSERPVIQMGGELVGFKDRLSLSQYGDRVRKERKLFHQLFGSHKAIRRFIPLQDSEIRMFLKRLLRNTEGALTEIQRMTGAIVLRIAYGYHLTSGPEQDPFLELFDLRSEIFAQSTQPLTFLVEFVPALRHWPEWLPGGAFRTTAKKWAKLLNDSVNAPHEYVKQQLAAGTAEASFTSTLLGEQPEEDYLIKWAASSIQAGGSTTTASQLEAFFLAMSLYPEVQAEAQKELDEVVGNNRLPKFSDRPHLPYMNALCKEVLRWHVAAPTGIPHRTREDFIYEREGGFQPLLIPKGSLVIANLWKMTHDPEQYANPMVFDPSRFINTDTRKAEQDPSKICFGYGRRICPGKLLADASVFMTCSMVLAVFNISKESKNGVSVEPRLGQTTGTVSQPLPFNCIVKPRNPQAISLI